jgi:hypothetical protein
MGAITIHGKSSYEQKVTQQKEALYYTREEGHKKASRPSLFSPPGFIFSTLRSWTSVSHITVMSM